MNATAHAGPLVLVATMGPSEEEQAYFKSVPDTQKIVLLHLSDEHLSWTDPTIYGMWTEKDGHCHACMVYNVPILLTPD